MQSSDCNPCKRKEGLYCQDGYRNYNEDEGSVWCETCPKNTAGTDGDCQECAAFTEPSSNRDECKLSIAFQVIIGIVGAIGITVCSVVAWCKKICCFAQCADNTSNQT